MVNTTVFTTQLRALMTQYDLSAARFSTKIGVQPSSISHLLSGRNKPSLDFVLKLLEAFPGLRLDWLMYGTGAAPFEQSTEETPPSPIPARDLFEDVPGEAPDPVVDKAGNATIKLSEQAIEQVIVCYTDGRCKTYKP